MKLNKAGSQPWRTLVNQQVTKQGIKLKNPIARSVAAVALLLPGLIFGIESMMAQGSEAAQAAAPMASLENGVYLYGQSPEPETVGSEYMVFEVNQGEVVGGFYMPRSSFDCFEGKVEADKLALTVIDSYERTPHEYAVALAATEPVASAGGTDVPVGLEGYHRIANLSDVDQQILTTCKADLN
jgi:hypothetical protein